MRADLFVHETQGVTTTLGRKDQLRVIFSGDKAGTDGKNVVLPALPAGLEIDDESARVMRGYADHESLHLRYSNVRVIKGLKDKDKTLGIWTNAIEDMRIERLGLREYPGMAKNIEAVANALNDNTLENFSGETDWNLKRWGAFAITWAGRLRNGLRSEAAEKLLDKLDPADRKKVEDWAAEIENTKSTMDAKRMAERIIAELAIEKEPQAESEDRDGEGERRKGKGGRRGGGTGATPGGSQAGAAGGGDGGEEAEAEDENDAAGEDEGDDEDGDEGDGDEDGDEDGEGDGDGDEEEDEDDKPAQGMRQEAPQQGGHGGVVRQEVSPPIDPELANAVNEQIEELVGAGSREMKHHYRVFTTQYDRWYKPGDGTSYGDMLSDPKNVTHYLQKEAETKATLSVMKRKLERMVLTEMRTDWNSGKLSGRLDSRRLVAASQGIPTVYRQRGDARELDTAVALLVDLSGSMSGAKAYLANQIIIAMSQALEVIGTPYSVMGFNTGETKGESMKKLHAEAKVYHKTGKREAFTFGRYEAVQMYLFKDFKDKLRLVRPSIGTINSCVDGANADGDSILYAWSRLRLRREKRRIMIVMSDGQPATAGNGTSGQHLEDVVSSLTKQGFETYGIGILSDAVRHYYPKYAVCRSLEDFATNCMDALAQLLLGSRVKVSVKTEAA